MLDNTSGHRSVPHTADLRIEVWSPSREGCIAEAALGTVESSLDTSLARAQRTANAERPQTATNLRVAVLEDVTSLLDTAARRRSTSTWMTWTAASTSPSR